MTTLSKKDTSKFIPLHFLFWLGVWFFFMYFFSYNSNDSVYVTWFSSFLLPVTMCVTYFVVYYLIPQYLLIKKYFQFILYSIYTLIFSTYFIIWTILGSFVFLSELDITDMPPMSRNFVFISILIYLIVILASCFSLIQHNFKTTAKNKDLENKILSNQLKFKEQELNYLKKQIHPHFLFNTLNTIYGFALKKSEDTPEIILKLSNLLDYILYQVQKPKVSLAEEISHIKEYIDLERIRFQDTLDISFDAEKIPLGLEIAPMMFLPFVENAFKHGSIINGKIQVKMKMKLENKQIIFTIKNTSIHEAEAENTKGLGLENIKKRLALNYGGNYELSTLQKGNYYEVKLIIPQKIKDAKND